MQQIAIILLSLFLVGFGQPAFSYWCALLTASVGYALFMWVLLGIAQGKRRFLLATAWFTGVQLIQLSWLVSHPYLYIYAVYFGLSLGVGLQFGILALFIQLEQIKKISRILALAGLWALFEWSRLYFLSGFSWNPSGLALSANLYSLQTASLVGIYGMSFWVLFVNFLALRAWTAKTELTPWLIWICAAVLPYAYGWAQLTYHQEAFAKHVEDPKNDYSTLLVQTAFPIEETLGLKSHTQMLAYVFDEWQQILKITKPHLGKPVDLVVLPEFTVPYGTYSCVFPYSVVLDAFKEIYGADIRTKLPPLEEPFATKLNTVQGDLWVVNNAFWSQALANIFNAEVAIGLEDVEEIQPGQMEYYSSAMHFQPHPAPLAINRYEKRVLVPMGEYIPFSFCKKLAASYGICGSFTPGTQAKAFGSKKLLGLSICYEETFGHLMRENKLIGADMLVNLTSDVWYPHSKLTQQHFDHARLRTVENGLPLVRACNTGVTCVVDSFGRVTAVLGESPEKAEWLADALHAKVPTYTYQTLYSRLGDTLIVCLSFVFVLCWLRYPR